MICICGVGTFQTSVSVKTVWPLSLVQSLALAAVLPTRRSHPAHFFKKRLLSLEHAVLFCAEMCNIAVKLQSVGGEQSSLVS